MGIGLGAVLHGQNSARVEPREADRCFLVRRTKKRARADGTIFKIDNRLRSGSTKVWIGYHSALDSFNAIGLKLSSHWLRAFLAWLRAFLALAQSFPRWALLSVPLIVIYFDVCLLAIFVCQLLIVAGTADAIAIYISLLFHYILGMLIAYKLQSAFFTSNLITNADYNFYNGRLQFFTNVHPDGF